MNTRFFATLFCLCLLASCSSAPPSPTPREKTADTTSTPWSRPSRPTPSPQQIERLEITGFNPASADASQVEEWITQAETAPLEERNELLLRAAEVLLRDGELDRADDLLREMIAPELEPDQAVRLALVRARVYRGHAQFSEALNQLSDPLVQHAIVESPLHRQLQFSQLRASLFAIEGNHLAAAQERIYIGPLLMPSQREQNRDAIWSSLMQVPTEKLVAHANSASDQDYLGWLELASIAKDNQGDIATQIQQRDAWLKRWPNHPTRNELPGGLDKLNKLIIERPDQVALLLPVSGRLAAYGKAIRDGFYAAYYEALSQGAQLPQIRQYDTAEADINRLYQQALTDGSKLIIGPLQKENLESLISGHPINMAAPTLALNRVPGDRFPSGLYQFGLNPEDEAVQIANIAFNKGYRRAMVITPEGAWGGKVASAFSDTWQAQGGTIVTSTNFNADKNNYSKQIKEALQIDGSTRRLNMLQQIIGIRPQFEPHRRTDMDFIFLVARPNEGRAIKPMLAYHYAGDVPVYATSHIYRGSSSPEKDQDINGIHFIDIPWIFAEDSAIRQNINHELPHSANYQRMYALGVDSFRLHLRLEQLRQTDTGRVFGETGTLSLNNLNQIERKLALAQIQNGRAVTVPMAELVEMR